MSRNPAMPVRSCIGCGGRAAQQSLLRIKLSADGALQIANNRNNIGRSGYLHTEPRCWKQFAARKGAVRSLGRSFAKEDRATFVRLLEETLGAK